MPLGYPAPRAPDSAPELRLLRSGDDYAACIRLQKETWGARFGEVVPASLLQVVNHVGGVAAGAFLESRLVGFVYGITGLDGGRPVHWSHMLAVRPGLRDLGIGRRLKEFQRDLLAPLGVEAILWSFDPLVARNAHLNLTRLGARVNEYVVDMYPGSGSDLHAFGSDRFIVEWSLADPRRSPLAESTATPACVDGTEPDGPAPDHVAIEIPPDIQAIATASPATAAAWRTASRHAFLAWLGRGYRITAFRRQPDTRCYYTLAAPDCSATTAGTRTGGRIEES